MKTELKILMLEDNVHDAELIEAELHSAGLSFHACCVQTQKAFVDSLVDDLPDVILSDHGLPEFTGLEALAMARQRCPEVPFIFVTGMAGTGPDLETFEQESVTCVLKSQLSGLAPIIRQALHDAGRHLGHQQKEPALLWGDEPRRALLDGIVDYAIYGLDEEGRITGWNAGAEWIGGHLGSEIQGQHFSCLYTPEVAETGQPVYALVQAAVLGRFREETIWLRKDGTLFWADVAIVSLPPGPENFPAFALVAHDISERKEREAEREQAIKELQHTLHDVKILAGLLPICASCKKVRDYTGQWHPLEVYLRAHSEATVIHEFCDECARHIRSSRGERPGAPL